MHNMSNRYLYVDNFGEATCTMCKHRELELMMHPDPFRITFGFGSKALGHDWECTLTLLSLRLLITDLPDRLSNALTALGAPAARYRPARYH